MFSLPNEDGEACLIIWTVWPDSLDSQTDRLLAGWSPIPEGSKRTPWTIILASAHACPSVARTGEAQLKGVGFYANKALNENKKTLQIPNSIVFIHLFIHLVNQSTGFPQRMLPDNAQCARRSTTT